MISPFSSPATAAFDPLLTLVIKGTDDGLPQIRPIKNNINIADIKLKPAPKNITRNLCQAFLPCKVLSFGISSSSPSSPAN